jgi:hypothetical protein
MNNTPTPPPKSILEYVMDSARHVTMKNVSDNFGGYQQPVIFAEINKNIDTENDLIGITRPYSKCANAKFPNK